MLAFRQEIHGKSRSRFHPVLRTTAARMHRRQSTFNPLELWQQRPDKIRAALDDIYDLLDQDAM